VLFVQRSGCEKAEMRLTNASYRPLGPHIPAGSAPSRITARRVRRNPASEHRPRRRSNPKNKDAPQAGRPVTSASPTVLTWTSGAESCVK